MRLSRPRRATALCGAAQVGEGSSRDSRGDSPGLAVQGCRSCFPGSPGPARLCCPQSAQGCGDMPPRVLLPLRLRAEGRDAGDTGVGHRLSEWGGGGQPGPWGRGGTLPSVSCAEAAEEAGGWEKPAGPRHQGRSEDQAGHKDTGMS